MDDEPLAAAASEEWRQQSNHELQITNISSAKLGDQIESARQTFAADVVIYPSRWIGEFVERGLIASMPTQYLDPSRDRLNTSDLFPLLVTEEIRWGKSICAVTFGTAPFALGYRTDRLPDGRQPPELWEDFDRWLGEFSDRERGVTFIAPLASGWAAPVVLARAAAYVRQSGQVSTYFSFQTLEPLVDQPPFVQALEALVTALGDNRMLALESTPADIRHRLLAGDCSVGWTWLADDDAEHTANINADIRLGFAELPGSEKFYSFSNDAWETRRESSDNRATFLGYDGRLGSVVKSSRRQSAAWNLLLRLTNDELGRRVSSVSHSTAPFRMSQIESTSLWTGGHLDATTIRQYGAVVKASLSRRQAMLALRLPGQREYMQALDTEVRAAVAGEKQPDAALRAVADKWREITDRLGREKQTHAYNRSLGIDP